MSTNQHFLFASTYGAGAYDRSTYDGSTTSQSSGNASGGESGSLLTNTGLDVALISTLACILIFISLIIRLWKRPAKKDQKLGSE